MNKFRFQKNKVKKNNNKDQKLFLSLMLSRIHNQYESKLEPSKLNFDLISLEKKEGKKKKEEKEQKTEHLIKIFDKLLDGFSEKTDIN